MKPRFKLLHSLQSKIILLTTTLVFCTALLIGGVNLPTIDGELKAAIDELAVKTRLTASKFRQGYEAMENDVFIVSQAMPIREITRSLHAVEAATSEQIRGGTWQTRLETGFISIMKARPSYTQMRLIGFSNGGRELVRVNRIPSGFERVRAGLRSSDMLARYPGDEFVIHLDTNAHKSTNACTQIAEKLAGMFQDRLLIGGYELQTGISIGIAHFPEHGRSLEELLHSADQAMYKARREHKPYAFAESDGTVRELVVQEA